MQVSQLTGQKSRLFNKILASSLLLIGSVLYAEPIGNVEESTGASQVTRQTGESYEGAVDLSVLFMDKMETMKGRMKVELIDESVFTITEHSMVIVDKFIYDPNPTKSTLALTFAKGTARFVTSKTGKIPKENISINTSSATIGIRGTDFTVTVDELGRTLVVLLPDETGAPSGSVIVSNLGGEIILDEAYQATLVQSYDVIPKETVILQGITIPMIDNMFIVNPPKEIRKIAEEEEKTTDEKGGILDIDYLDFDALEDDALNREDAFEFTELDINLLDVDFLQDVLDIVAELDKLTELDRKSEEIDSINIEGTTIGFDQDTQYNTLVDKSAGKITLNREVSGKIRITQPIYSNARIVTITDQKPSDIILGDGSGANITIIQQ